MFSRSMWYASYSTRSWGEELLFRGILLPQMNGVFKLIPVRETKGKKKSSLEGIKGIKANVTMDDILAAIRESRERE